nr:hypothetical protein [Tanacetum cinerariifolium]
MSYVIDFTILEHTETNIDPSLSQVIFGRPFVEIACLAINRKYGLMTFTDGIKVITFKTPFKDPKRSELSSEGHDLLSSRVILSEDDYDRGCRKPSDLEDGFYRDTIKLGPEYATRMDDEGEVTLCLDASNSSNDLSTSGLHHFTARSYSLILRIQLVLIRPNWNASIAIKYLPETIELKRIKTVEEEMVGTMETKLETKAED